MWRTAWRILWRIPIVCIVGLVAQGDAPISTDDPEQVGARLAHSLNGYEWLVSAFAIESATLGNINMFDKSLFVELEARRSCLVDQVRWWNPVQELDHLRYDWHHFKAAYEEAADQISKHSWIAEWKRLDRGRHVELQLSGQEIGETQFDLQTFHLPAWQDAGLTGAPTHSVLLRRPSGGWVHVLMGRSETRSLVVSTHLRPGDDRSGHWADTTELSFHPRGHVDDFYSRFVIVSASGQTETRTFTKAFPPKERKSVNVSYSDDDGSSFEKAVVIKMSDYRDAEDAERNYLDQHFPGSILGSRDVLTDHDSKAYDVVHLVTLNGERKIIYFEVSSAFQPK